MVWTLQTINLYIRKIWKENGKIILVKINVDGNQQIAEQLNVRSIPTVYGFVVEAIDAQSAQPKVKF